MTLRLCSLRLALGLLCLFAACGSLSAQNVNSTSNGMQVCKGTYALCTTAKCRPAVNGTSETAGTLLCGCSVQQGYSAGMSSQSCSAVPQQPPSIGLQLPSRYYPIKSYVQCPAPGEAPVVWAWCLDMACVADKKLPGNKWGATCKCKASNATGPYIWVTDRASYSGCRKIISSATLADVQQVNTFLEQSTLLQPFPIKVLKPKSKLTTTKGAKDNQPSN